MMVSREEVRRAAYAAPSAIFIAGQHQTFFEYTDAEATS